MTSSPRRVHLPLGVIPLAVLSLGNAVWVATQRADLPLDIDEAGYASIALRDLNGLTSDGLPGWWHAIEAQPVQAPLAPALTSVLHRLFGVHLVNQLLVSLVAYVVIVALALAYTRSWPFLARAISLATVSCSPVLLLYSRSMNFALLASAALASAMYFQLRSDSFGRWSGSLLWGASIGAMVLSRTMTIAFVPALLLAATVPCLQPGWRRRFARMALGLAVAGLVAGSWYAYNWRGVWDYLTSYGYGAQAADYGSRRNLLSVSGWYNLLIDRADQFLWAGITLVLVVGILCAAVVAVQVITDDWTTVATARRARARRAWTRVARSRATAPAVVSSFCLAALSTSTNVGSGFMAPLMFPLALTAGWGIDSASRAVRRRGPISRTLGSPTVALTVVLVCVVPAAALTFLPRSDVVMSNARLPGGRSLTVWDSRSILRIYLDDGAVPPTVASDVGDVGYALAWDAENAWLEAEMRRTAPTGQRPLLVFTDRHMLLNLNSLTLRGLLSGDTASVVTWIDPTLGRSVDSLVAQTSGYRDYITSVVTITPGPDEFLPAVPDAVGERLISELRLRLSATRTLPDGRVMQLWVRI